MALYLPLISPSHNLSSSKAHTGASFSAYGSSFRPWHANRDISLGAKGAAVQFRVPALGACTDKASVKDLNISMEELVQKVQSWRPCGLSA